MADSNQAELERLLQEARRAAKSAYAPYSRYPVGAALVTERGATFIGCNVENASYPLSMCAERNSVFAAVTAEGPEMRVRAIAVFAEKGTSAPCGACRQVLAQFGLDATVWFDGKARTVRELLPDTFELDLDREQVGGATAP